MRSSAGNVKRSKVEIDADPEQEDDYGYTTSEYTFYLEIFYYQYLLKSIYLSYLSSSMVINFIYHLEKVQNLIESLLTCIKSEKNKLIILIIN